MPGFTKHMYLNDLNKIKSDFSNYIKNIIQILSEEYNLDSIMYILEKYYPYECQILNEKYDYYCLKDKKLIPLNKKVRYLMPKPKSIIRGLKITKKILSKTYKDNYALNFDKNLQLENEELLKKEREPKINKIKEKIDKAKLKAQEVEPSFLDELMGLYERKRTTQKDKVYIFKELEKYYCLKVISFF
ncbi:hypothetical protein CcarbDRAFT_0582 [Clostridium carboxidivorans P7]|uniref:Uncharacterized protein n=1 Tax=Clostridium carboxidivorans P7 TaxID=536227 RepID=C6PP65_9CLOT|nr:hypothetical protein [Clostridium carboxidivorans]EET88943.1 hypothetical protein CcarbDRAFT_0582 [Clostridium carboxidivorans P7]